MNHNHGLKRLMQRAAIAILFACIMTLVCACTAGGPPPTAKIQDVINKEALAQRDIKNLNEKIFSSVSTAPKTEDYIICAGDLLDVTVFHADELKKEARVASSGIVTLPLIGTVQVKGLTKRQAETTIESLYGSKYLENPRVDIFIKEHQGGKISLLGSVEKPGTYDYLASRRLLDALALAGGISDKSSRTVQVRRPSTDPNIPPSSFTIDLDELLERGNSELNIQVYAGDVIFAPAAGVVFVDGAVHKPGNFPLKAGMSVQEAITGAGGFSRIADPGNIKLVRYTDEGKREVTQVKFHESSEQHPSDNVKLKDRDMVFVEASKVRNFLYSINFNLGNGIIGAGYTPPYDNK